MKSIQKSAASRVGANIGTRINVRSDWVGPKGWIGANGKIYAVRDERPCVDR